MKQQRVRFAIVLLGLQGLAAMFFVADSVLDTGHVAERTSWQPNSWIEAGLAVALLGGIVLSGLLVRRLMIEAHRREQALALAKGALADVIAARFGQWRLSAAEADVALFSLKGSSIAEIARMRGSAEGTVRAQLSQVYAKAGVASQPTFVALFVEELLE